MRLKAAWPSHCGVVIPWVETTVAVKPQIRGPILRHVAARVIPWRVVPVRSNARFSLEPVGGEPSERRVSGSHFVLLDGQGRTVAETVSDPKGAFHFAVERGDYVLADERNRTRVRVEPGKRVNLRLTWTNK